jgi:glycosyltransferase involved in cell wall biosynthesis
MLRKRIILVIDNLKTGGAEQVFADLCHLINTNIEVDTLFILPKQAEAYKLPPNIKKLYLNRHHKWSISTMYKCAQILKQYDIAHVHMRHTFRYISMIKHLFKLQVKLILHDHYGSIRVNQSPPFGEYKLSKPDVYIGVSEELTTWAREVWGLDTNKTFTLINLPSQRFLQKIGYSDTNTNDRNGLVVVGNIKPIKNQLKALEIAVTIGHDITFIGKNQDASYAKQLQIALTNSTIGQWLENVNDVSKHLPKYRLGLCTSESESGPLILIEYLLCNLPFLAFKTGGISEVIYKYFPEYFLTNFDTDQWVNAARNLLNQPPYVDPVRLNAMMAQEFNAEDYCSKLFEIYAK